jgi:hypothetical protein
MEFGQLRIRRTQNLGRVTGKRAHLVMNGTIQSRAHPSPSRPKLSDSVKRTQPDTQTSPMTLALEVRISARIMSENGTWEFRDDNIIRLKALQGARPFLFISVVTISTGAIGRNAPQKHHSLTFVQHIPRCDRNSSHHNRRKRRNRSPLDHKFRYSSRNLVKDEPTCTRPCET